MDYLIAIDGGGTKTDVAFATLDGSIVAQVRVDGTSLSHHSQAAVAATLASAWRQLPNSLEHCRGACAGFASAGVPANAAWYRQTLSALLPNAPRGVAAVEVTTDAALAFEGATNGNDGLLVIAGTGSIALGRRGEREARAGGAGPPADLGSGDWIARQAVAAGLLPPPVDRPYAALVPELDPEINAAEKIFENAGAALAALLHSCADLLAWPDAPAYAIGGVVENVPVVRATLERHWGRPLLTPFGTALDAALRRAHALLS